jgi:hypothetical protein
MKFIKLLTLVVLPSLLFANGKVAKNILDAQSQSTFPSFSITNVSNLSLKDQDLDRSVTDGVLLELDQEKIKNLIKAKHETLSLSFQTPDGTLKLDLIKNQVLSEDFLLKRSSNRNNPAKYRAGLYYNGIISGDLNSLASVTIFDNELMVFIHQGSSNTVIGKLKDSNLHIAYKYADLTQTFDIDCATDDDGKGYPKEMLHYEENRAPGDCIRVYFEIDDDIVSQKGGVANATNYLTGLMNETITLYANDGITMVISEILAWDTPAPYSGSSSSAMLSAFQNNTGNFNGDLSHLVSYQASGGVAAGFSGICNPNVDNSKCFSSIDSYYNSVPNYSYTVMVVTHEMGHLIGSRHTHACVWNGNNTAIDGCAGYTEGGCSLPGNPSNGGTIMSYCHVATGIDFTQGFGAQPRAVLLNTIANSNCTSPCSGPSPTCNDGIQNGDETGVDCGGSSCPPCSGGCTDNAVTVSITFDNYPEETSWQITDANGSTVASGGTYGSQPDGSTINIDLCLVDGCYDFTILDVYGDGICCSYGNGSYTVTSGGTTLASGGSFASSETTNFCLGPPPPTCDDGIQNGDETGVDCGGSSCPPCNTGCSENEATLAITFDNYPEETSWQITDANGSIVASGGTYGSQPDGSTLSLDLCIADGCYDFTILDAYGDGICCSYGNGSYSLTSGGIILASGGSFASSETTNFCFGPPPATCDDGVQNGDETGVDCGGSSCPPCNTGGQILGSYFESGWDGWIDGGSDCYRYSGSRSYEGSYSIRLRDNSGTASSMTSPTLNLSGYSSITVEFYFYAYSMELGEDFWLRYYNGSSWSTVGTWARGTSFENNNFYVASVTLDASNVNFSSNSAIRFQCDASANADQIYIDQVTVTASAGTLIENSEIVTTISEIELDNQVNPVSIESEIDYKFEMEKIKVFPNPATDILNISATSEINTLNIISVSGQVVKVLNQTELKESINISDLNPGVYYILIETEGEFIPKKFVKL